jgi:hypothetical protein
MSITLQKGATAYPESDIGRVGLDRVPYAFRNIGRLLEFKFVSAYCMAVEEAVFATDPC